MEDHKARHQRIQEMSVEGIKMSKSYESALQHGRYIRRSDPFNYRPQTSLKSSLDVSVRIQSSQKEFEEDDEDRNTHSDTELQCDSIGGTHSKNNSRSIPDIRLFYRNWRTGSNTGADFNYYDMHYTAKAQSLGPRIQKKELNGLKTSTSVLAFSSKEVGF